MLYSKEKARLNFTDNQADCQSWGQPVNWPHLPWVQKALQNLILTSNWNSWIAQCQFFYAPKLSTMYLCKKPIFNYLYINRGVFPELFDPVSDLVIHPGFCSMDHCQGNPLIQICNPVHHWMFGPTKECHHCFETCFTTENVNSNLLRCTQVEVAKWTSIFWYKKNDGHHGIKFAHGPVFTFRYWNESHLSLGQKGCTQVEVAEWTPIVLEQRKVAEWPPMVLEQSNPLFGLMTNDFIWKSLWNDVVIWLDKHSSKIHQNMNYMKVFWPFRKKGW